MTSFWEARRIDPRSGREESHRMTKAAVDKTLRNHRVVIHLTNGETLDVPHPDHVSYSPTSPEIVVWTRGPVFAVVALDEIARIAVLPSPGIRPAA
ncbi:MAG: hypothetical protein J0L84_20690 [Verrucomicrobia bacterium]|nr:hypothetical protein [Verrucomicrobiota bacterium]